MKWHPFKVDMEADRVLEVARKRRMRRVAKNEIVGQEDGRLVVKWHFEACTLLIRFDPEKPPYRVSEIHEPLETGVFLTTKQAALSPEELKSQIDKIKEN